MKGDTNRPDAPINGLCDLCHRLTDNCDGDRCARCEDWACHNCAQDFHGRWVCDDCIEAEKAEYAMGLAEEAVEREADEKRDMGDKYHQERRS